MSSQAALRQPPGALAIRAAVPADAGFGRAVAEAAYAKYVPRMHKPPAPLFYDYAAVFAEGHSHVITQDGEPVGMVTLVPAADHLLLRNLAVLPGSQGRGVGRTVLAFAEAEALRLGLPEVRLWTNEKMAENVPYYEANGYAVTHRAVVDGYSRIFMSKPVRAPGNATEDGHGR